MSVAERIRQIESANPEIDDANTRRPELRSQTPGHLAAEGIVSQEDVADAGDQDSRIFVNQPPAFGSGVSPLSKPDWPSAAA